ncbi:rab-GTPase-TBC domain-containing protein [Absidia repens]|uniref:Rab-GTPase-TBC domain-containing protein n=1 Tax=Absidia repens TaxID=90262 RepID=A0A1X2I7E7_9FUNG|nr:rab-GTPase-TBC domain-containing protein [Absidia repens]
MSFNKKSNTKNTLKRSFTTRHDNYSAKKPSSRPRASSFTTLFRRQQLQQEQRQTSAADTPFSKNTNVSSTLSQSSSSFLTVNDAVIGGATSSVDSGSDDDDDDADYIHYDNQHLHPSSSSSSTTKKKRNPGLQMNTSVSSFHDDHASSTATATALSVPLTAPPLEKKLSTTFKEKLNLTRRSQSTKATNNSNATSTRHSQNVFQLWKHQQNNVNHSGFFSNGSIGDKENGLPKLYDDGKGLYPPPQTTDPNRRDQYGFTRSTQWITTQEYDAFEQQYHPITCRRSQKWRSLLEENNGEWPQRTSKFKRYVRKGIPPEFRRQAWLHYSGAEEKMNCHVGVYEQCVEKAMALGVDSEHLDIIERDLHRTFPDNDKFRSTSRSPVATPRPQDDDVPAIQALRRLLYAFSVYSPSIGYCQSLNYIAGLLLLFMAEEEAFWTFVVLVHDILPPNVYDVTMEGASIDQNILMMLLSERCPLIWQRIGGGRTFWECEDPDGLGMPTSSLVTSHWFLTLFINILPTESVLRVWDCLFL